MTRIARESGVTLSYVSKLRSGRSTPSAAVIVSLSVALGAPVLDVMRAFELIREDGSINPHPSAAEERHRKKAA